MNTIGRMLGACLSFLCALPGIVGAAEEAARPNLLLITVDTLRADRLGAYGYDADTTPALDRLAKRAVRFDDVTVQWPQTWPSIASMMTGTYPATTGVRFAQRNLRRHNQTLAEVLAAAGYQTAAVVGNVTIGKHAGFDQGFEIFVEPWNDQTAATTAARLEDDPQHAKQLANATIVTDKALEILEKTDTSRPYFLWLHYIDPHGPYVPPPRYSALFEGRHPVEAVDTRLLPEYQRQPAPDGVNGDLGFYKTQYDRSIRYLDDELSRLLEKLAGAPRGDDTLVVVTADHGESLGEHRYYLEHGALAYQPTARVPLLIALDGKLPAGAVVEQPVGLIDLTPTLLDILGVVPSSAIQGRSLVPLMRGESDGAPRDIFMEAGQRPQSQVAVRRGPWKLVHYRSPADRYWRHLPEVALFNLDRDPAESTNVIAQQPELATELRATLDAWVERGERQHRAQVPEIKRLDKPAQEMMRVLGYGG